MKRLIVALIFIAAPACAQFTGSATGSSIGAHTVGGSSSCVSTAVTPNIVTQRTTGVAPLFVSFDGTATTNTGGWSSFGDLLYEWDYGDTGSSGSGTWTYWGQSRDEDRGPIAGHIYEETGGFTATLTVTDPNGGCKRTTVDIVVTNPDTVYATTSTLCVSSSGLPVAGAGGCPTGASVSNSSDYDASVQTGAGARTLFKRGDTFTASAGKSFASSGPTSIGAYGSGNPPLITKTTTSALHTITGPTDGDLRFYDLDIDVDATGAFITRTGTTTYIQNVTLLRVRRDTGSSTAVSDLAILDTPNGGSDIHNGIVIQESVWADCDNDCIYVMGRQMAFLGNELSDANTVHLQRNGIFRQSVIAHNYFHDPGASSVHMLKLHAKQGGTSHGLGESTEGVIWSNRFVGTAGASVEVFVAPQNSTNTQEYVHEIIAEANVLDCAGATIGCFVFATTDNTWVRNNIVELDDSELGIVFQKRGGAAPDVTQTGFHAWNNTCVEPTASGTEVCVAMQTGTVKEAHNTLLVGEGTLDAVSGASTETSSLTLDLSAACTFETCPPVISDPTDYKITSGSSTDDAGTCPAAATVDFEGDNRPVGAACDIGSDEEETP